MKTDATALPGQDAAAEISTLIETLHRSEQRLSVLTAGEVDAVSNRAGRTLLLGDAQEQLRDTKESREAAILDALPAHVALIDLRGCIVSVNRTWLQRACASALQGPDYAVGLNYLECCETASGPDAALARDAARGMRAVIDGTRLRYTVEYACRAPDEQRWFQLTVSPLGDDPPSGAVVMHTDITALIDAQRAMQRSSELLSAVAAGTPDMVFVKDLDGRYLLCNESFARFAGRSSEEMIGETYESLFGSAGLRENCETDRFVMQTGQPVSTEDELIGAVSSGTFLATKAPYRDKSGAVIGVIGISRDISERKRAEGEARLLAARQTSELEDRVARRTAELNLAREDAEQANRAKSAFLAAMSHEIRTPMNGVVGMIDVLEQSSLKSSQAEIVKTVRESAYALLGIVDDVLDFSKIEAGHFQIDHDPMAVGPVVERVVDTLDHLAASKGVSLRVEVDPSIPPCVRGDPARLRQVLLNLIGNAIKFSSKGDPAGTVDVRARLVGRAAGAASVEFAVRDNGIGMDESTLSRLFTPFTQADDSTTKRFGGTGLGLSISSRLAELMGGVIEVRSEPGRGSQFTLRLPFDVVEAGAAAAAPDHADFRDETGAGDLDSLPMPLAAPGASPVDRLILVAEDNEINQRVIRRQLALLGFTTDIACDGREALARWREGAHALLLTDLHMPTMDGYELAAAIRENEAEGARIPIVALTANALKGEARRCKDVGMDDYMTKPVRLADLHAMLTKWMHPSAKPLPLRKPRRLDERSQAKRPLSRSSFADERAPPADLSVLTALVGDDRSVVREMLEAFDASATRSAEAIRYGAATADQKAVADAAHSLKSGARSIGADALGAICDELEHLADAGRTAQLAPLLARFDAELRAVQLFLRDRAAR